MDPPDPLRLLDFLDGESEVVPLASLNHFTRVCGPALGIGSLHLIQSPDEASAATLRQRLAAMPGVAFAQPNHVIVREPGAPATDAPAPAAPDGPGHSSPPGHTPDDPLFDRQWSLRNTGQALGAQGSMLTGVPDADIDADEAWAVGATGEGQIIAVLDDALSVSHPDLAPNMWVNHGEIPGNELDDDGNGWVDDLHGWNVGPESPHLSVGGHGTHVAGVAAARGDNGIGGSGVAPRAKLMGVQFLQGTLHSQTEAYALGAFAYAIANGATIINNSWGVPWPVGLGSPVMALAIRCAELHDIEIAWSGGNLPGVPQSFPGYYPFPNIVQTGGFGAHGCPLSTYQMNPALVDVMAPGHWITSTSGSDDYTLSFAGTSAAAPHVAGVAALLRQMRPELTAAQVVRAIINGSRAPFPEPWSASLGYLNAAGALHADPDRLLPELPAGVDPLQSWPVRCGAAFRF